MVMTKETAAPLLRGKRAIAEHLGLPRATVDRLVATGALPTFRLSSRIVCARPATLRAFIDAREAEGMPQRDRLNRGEAA